jgi:hypothetical protein
VIGHLSDFAACHTFAAPVFEKSSQARESMLDRPEARLNTAFSAVSDPLMGRKAMPNQAGREG